MENRPAVIIIVRHGARLDAADKSWHLTSPTPYDPPLTYGGWTQSRSLGLRIAGLLHAREESACGDVPAEPHELTAAANTATNSADGPVPKRGRRRHKVYIHSSPFQRCVQTSVGISAGISQYHGLAVGRARGDNRPGNSWESRPSPRLHAVDATAASVAAKSNLRKTLKDGTARAKLRIDACLGEWLSPDYFDSITPPPNSTMMVAGAKADLLRRGEGLDAYSSLANRTSQGSLWSSNRSSIASQGSDEILDMHQLIHALPGRDRTASFNSGRVSPFGRPAVMKVGPGELAGALGYTPPTPGYAIAPVDPIPRGYVAHARDACVDIDYQWDSMREPLSWGDGGEYGEEWSAMHKRFRKGLVDLIGFYSKHPDGEPPDDFVAVPSADQHHEDGDVDEENVIVIVTHGAGCNALIGALTEQPVLLDVGVASLTMAVTKAHAAAERSTDEIGLPNSTGTTSPPLDGVRRGSRAAINVTTGLSELYDMKIVASSGHLRPGTDPSRPNTPNTSNPALPASKTVPESRRRSTLFSHATPHDSSWAGAEHPRGSTNAALGSIRRISGQPLIKTQRSGSASSGTSMTGLWAPTTPPLGDIGKEREKELHPLDDKKDSPGRDLVLDFSDSITSSHAGDDSLGMSYASRGGLTVAPPMAPLRSKSDDPSSVPRISMTSASPRREEADSLSELPNVSVQAPVSIGRTLSQKGLWGSAPSGVHERDRGPKRRWTLQQE